MSGILSPALDKSRDVPERYGIFPQLDNCKYEALICELVSMGICLEPDYKRAH